MISPNSNVPEAGEPAVADAVDAFFQPGGRLEKACEAEPFPYEHRPQQQEMARAVGEAADAQDHLVVEAGTGVGKSFAYLVPTILSAIARKTKVVISTYTISLQEQLMMKDIPFLRDHLGADFKAVMVKGRSNYLCLRRLARARKMGDDLFHTQQAVELDRIRAWADQTLDGSLQDLDDQPSTDVWSMVCAEQGNCMYQKCPEYGRCHFIHSRKQMAEADVLVVNHHLFFSDLSLRSKGAPFLPAYETVVLDEAHIVESVAGEHLGVRLSERMFDYWMGRLHVADTNKGILAALRAGEAAHAVGRLRETVRAFFAEVRNWAQFDENRSQRVVPDPLALDVDLSDTLRVVLSLLDELTLSLKDEEVQAELQALQRRGESMRDELHAFLSQAMDQQVYWMEQGGQKRRNITLRSAPVEVGDTLRTVLFEEIPCVVLTSATLAIRDDLAYFRNRVGAEDCRGLKVGSPFDYARQMRVYLPTPMPQPNDLQAYCQAAGKAIEHFVAQTAGQAFVLFTSTKMMRQVENEVGNALEMAGYRLLVQGAGLTRHRMLAEFRRHSNCVLFGLDSFWAGVDVPGDALRNVIIARLPFAVPDHPVVAARMKRIEAGGGNSFKDYSLPEAILRFRQGVGRLIRTGTDEGIVVVLDPRIREKWYGKLFLSALPECPVEIVDLGSGPREEGVVYEDE